MSTTTRRGLLTAAAWSGAAAFLDAEANGRAIAATGRSGRVREFWIAAEPFQHCLVPTGRDAMSGARLEKSKATFWALRYRAYTPLLHAP